jgi:hypothetical protein
VNSDGEVNNTGIIKKKTEKKCSTKYQVQESQKVQSFGKSSRVTPLVFNLGTGIQVEALTR